MITYVYPSKNNSSSSSFEFNYKISPQRNTNPANALPKYLKSVRQEKD